MEILNRVNEFGINGHYKLDSLEDNKKKSDIHLFTKITK